MDTPTTSSFRWTASSPPTTPPRSNTRASPLSLIDLSTRPSHSLDGRATVNSFKRSKACTLNAKAANQYRTHWLCAIFNFITKVIGSFIIYTDYILYTRMALLVCYTRSIILAKSTKVFLSFSFTIQIYYLE
jgi:hypothetical protein